ncbi:hypothetical protein Tco_0857900 [Tanacetum coccineum]|uniref:Synaptobrevin, longin-like domain protein n=1 Tax=Tanacetum coccineum TaxID=301880 RepID=A0ABQ5BAK7_9ASTR
MVAFLDKSTGSAGFHQIIDFLNRSHICYALTKKPEVCVSFIKQFWRSAEASTDDHGEVKINATIDDHSLSITEGSLRRHLKLADQDGITSLPNSEIFEQLALMGYHTDSDKLTFQKGVFSPQWRFLIHKYLSLLSPKKEALGAVLVFSNMKRPTKGFSGQEVALFPTMLAVPTPSTLPSKITSSPSPYTFTIKIRKARRQARVVLSDDEVFEDDSSKQGRKLSDEEVQEKVISTAGAKKGTTAKEVPIVSTAKVDISTAGGTVTYVRRSAEKRSRQDKGEESINVRREAQEEIKEGT